MISARLRALGVLAAALPAPRATASTLSLRVWPGDVDLNVHLTNARYQQFMDLGRLDLLARAGLLAPLFLTDARPIAVAVSIRYLRELRLGQRFVLETRVEGRDRKAVIFRQRFLVGDTEHADGIAKVVLRRRGKVVEPALLRPLLEAAGATP